MLKLSGLNWRIATIMAGVAVVLLLAWAGTRSLRNRNEAEPLKNLGPGLHQSKPEQSGELLPLPK